MATRPSFYEAEVRYILETFEIEAKENMVTDVFICELEVLSHRYKFVNGEWEYIGLYYADDDVLVEAP